MKKLSIMFIVLLLIGTSSIYAVETTGDDTTATVTDTGTVATDSSSGSEEDLLSGLEDLENLTEEDNTTDELTGVDGTVDNDFTGATDVNVGNDGTNVDTTQQPVVVQKVEFEVENVSPTSITVKLKKLEDYVNYKIYYSKEGSSELSEQEVIFKNGETETGVVIGNLEPNTNYQLIAKAFDVDGNPVEATTSDTVNVSTPEEHKAPEDNVIYNPVVKVNGNEIIVSYKPGADVKKVKISISDDGQTFKNIANLVASQTSYKIKVDTTGKKYIKLVPIADDGTAGICKIGTTDVPFLTANIKPKKEAQKNMGKPKTGPELYVLFIIAVLGYIVYSLKNKLNN